MFFILQKQIDHSLLSLHHHFLHQIQSFFAPENTNTDEIIDRYTMLNNNIKSLKLELNQKLKHDPVRINGNCFPLITNKITDKVSIPKFKALYITLCEYEKILPTEFILKIFSKIQ